MDVGATTDFRIRTQVQGPLGEAGRLRPIGIWVPCNATCNASLGPSFSAKA